MNCVNEKKEAYQPFGITRITDSITQIWFHLQPSQNDKNTKFYFNVHKKHSDLKYILQCWEK